MAEFRKTIQINSVEKKNAKISAAHEHGVAESAGPLQLVTHGDQQEKRDYSFRAQWIQAAQVGAIHGLVQVSSITLGIGAVQTDENAAFTVELTALVAGILHRAMREFKAIYELLDVEIDQVKREKGVSAKDVLIKENERLRDAVEVSLVGGLAYAVGGIVPVFASGLVRSMKLSVTMLVAVFISALLVLLGLFCAVLGRSPIMKSFIRVLIGGLMAVGIAFGITELVGHNRMHI